MYISFDMDITWDPNKIEINFKKHGVRFPDAEFVLFDPFAMTLEDHWVAGEERFVTVGSDAVGRISPLYIHTVQITSV